MNVINGTNLEFGWSLVGGLLVPAALRRAEVPVKVYHNIWLPKEISRQVASEYVLASPKFAEPTSFKDEDHPKSLIRAILSVFKTGLTSPENVRPLPVPMEKGFLDPWGVLERVRGWKYVCVIPAIFEERVGKHFGWLPSEPVNPWHLQASLRFCEWERIVKFLRRQGCIVVGFADGVSCSFQSLEKLSDIACHLYPRVINYDLWWQLQVMRRAVVTIGVGGGGFPAYAFDVPGVSLDGAFGNAFREITPSCITHRTTPLKMITGQTRLAAKYPWYGREPYHLHVDDLHRAYADKIIDDTKSVLEGA